MIVPLPPRAEWPQPLEPLLEVLAVRGGARALRAYVAARMLATRAAGVPEEYGFDLTLSRAAVEALYDELFDVDGYLWLHHIIAEARRDYEPPEPRPRRERRELSVKDSRNFRFPR